MVIPHRQRPATISREGLGPLLPELRDLVPLEKDYLPDAVIHCSGETFQKGASRRLLCLISLLLFIARLHLLVCPRPFTGRIRCKSTLV
jgi:hypothetical protein